MDLVLWRHAEAEEADAALPDLERPLTARGERQAARMAQWLQRQMPHDLRVLASPAERTQRTAMALERKFRTVAELAPEGSATALLAAAGWPLAKRMVIVVGHQPTLGRAAALALTGQEADWSVRKGAVWWLRFRERERGGKDEAGCVLHCVQSPDTL
jgi:phosphohistidine phosphatase